MDKKLGQRVSTRFPMQIEEDLTIISEMAVRGCSYKEILARVDISETQLKRDLRKIRERWQKRQADNMEIVIVRELEKLDLIERKAFAAWEKAEDAGTYPDTQYLNLVLRAMERRARLLGIEKPIEQHNHVSFQSENIAQLVLNNPTLIAHEKQFWIDAAADNGEPGISGDSADSTE